MGSFYWYRGVPGRPKILSQILCSFSWLDHSSWLGSSLYSRQVLGPGTQAGAVASCVSASGLSLVHRCFSPGSEPQAGMESIVSVMCLNETFRDENHEIPVLAREKLSWVIVVTCTYWILNLNIVVGLKIKSEVQIRSTWHVKVMSLHHHFWKLEDVSRYPVTDPWEDFPDEALQSETSFFCSRGLKAKLKTWWPCWLTAAKSFVNDRIEGELRKFNLYELSPTSRSKWSNLNIGNSMMIINMMFWGLKAIHSSVVSFFHLISWCSQFYSFLIIIGNLGSFCHIIKSLLCTVCQCVDSDPATGFIFGNLGSFCHIIKSLLCTVCVDSDPATGFIFDMTWRVSLRKQLSLLPEQKNISSLPKSSDYGLNGLPSS